MSVVLIVDDVVDEDADDVEENDDDDVEEGDDDDYDDDIKFNVHSMVHQTISTMCSQKHFSP